MDVKPVLGYEGLYEVSSCGRVFSLYWDEPRELKPDVAHNGYLRVALSKAGQVKRFPVHRLVALAFIGPQPTPDHVIAHGDGTRDNNCVGNLRWATHSENAYDRFRVHKRGHPHWTTRNPLLTEREVWLIRELWSTGCHSRGDLAKRFEVDPQLISDVATRRQYNGNMAWIR